MTRLEAAEKAVIEAALAWSLSEGTNMANTAIRNEKEACARLLALRAEIEEKQPRCEAPAAARVMWRGDRAEDAALGWRSVEHQTIYCELPQGHDGEHLARPDGEWRWT